GLDRDETVAYRPFCGSRYRGGAECDVVCVTRAGQRDGSASPPPPARSPSPTPGAPGTEPAPERARAGEEVRMAGKPRWGLIAAALVFAAAVIAVVILARREAGPAGPPSAAPAAEQAEGAAPGSGTLPGGPSAPPPAEVPTAGPTERDLQIFNETMAWARAERLDTLPIGEIMVRIGRRFVGAPYEPGLLEVPGPERLVVDLREYDCVTYVETMLALARMVRAGEDDFDTFQRELARI